MYSALLLLGWLLVCCLAAALLRKMFVVCFRACVNIGLCFSRGRGFGIVWHAVERLNTFKTFYNVALDDLIILVPRIS